MPVAAAIGVGIAAVGLGAQLIGQRRQKKVAYAEAEANIGAYQDFLAAFPDYQRTQIETAESAGSQQLKQLMSNLGNINVAAGATGQVGRGTSASLLAQGAREEVTGFAGEDMALGGAEGSYERELGLLKRNLSAERTQAEAQLDVWETTKEQSGTGRQRRQNRRAKRRRNRG